MYLFVSIYFWKTKTPGKETKCPLTKKDTGNPFRSGDLGVMSPDALPLRHAGVMNRGRRTPPATPQRRGRGLMGRMPPSASLKRTKDKYRRLGSNQCPRGYEPRALPLRHPGESYQGATNAPCNPSVHPVRRGV